jgi:hypothetical protein
MTTSGKKNGEVEHVIDSEAYMLLALFQTAFNMEGDDDSPKEYLKKYKRPIERIGEIFAWLGLASWTRDLRLAGDQQLGYSTSS